MSEAFERVVRDKESAHQAICDGYAVAKLIVGDGRRAVIAVGEHNDPLTVRQRKFLHGPVLAQIAEQVSVDGERYVPKVWKEYLRSLFLGSEFVQVGTRTVEVRKSTEDLDVREYSEYIDRVLAHAATEWGVEFVFKEGEREAVRYRPPQRAQPKEKATC